MSSSAEDGSKSWRPDLAQKRRIVEIIWPNNIARPCAALVWGFFAIFFYTETRTRRLTDQIINIKIILLR